MQTKCVLYIEHITKNTIYYAFPLFNDASANLMYVTVSISLPGNSAQMDDVSVDLLMRVYMQHVKVCQNVM